MRSKSLDANGGKRRREVLLEGTPWPNHPGHYSGLSDLHIFFLVHLAQLKTFTNESIPVGERAIAFIVEADSPEEVDSLLYGIPFWAVTKTKVTPLQDWGSRRELDRQATEQMEQSLQR